MALFALTPLESWSIVSTVVLVAYLLAVKLARRFPPSPPPLTPFEVALEELRLDVERTGAAIGEAMAPPLDAMRRSLEDVARAFTAADVAALFDVPLELVEDRPRPFDWSIDDVDA